MNRLATKKINETKAFQDNAKNEFNLKRKAETHHEQQQRDLKQSLNDRTKLVQSKLRQGTNDDIIMTSSLINRSHRGS